MKERLRSNIISTNIHTLSLFTDLYSTSFVKVTTLPARNWKMQKPISRELMLWYLTQFLDCPHLN